MRESIEMKNIAKSLLLASIGIASSPQANDLNINGFLSVGASMLDNDKVEISGYDTNGGFKQDTILGLQLSKQVNDSTTVTGQLVSRGSEDYNTESAWAYINFAANDDLDLRMGRLRVPFYYYSDFLEVGFAYDWIRPPAEVYSVPFSSVDGVDATYRFSIGNWDNSAQAYYGRYTPEGAGVDLRNFTGLALSGQTGDFSLRASYHRLEIISDGTGSFGAVNQGAAALIGTTGSALNTGLLAAGYSNQDIAGAVDDFTLTGQEIGFYGIAAGYDNGNYSAIAEYTQSFGDAPFIPIVNTYLVKAAKRFSDITAHLTFTSSETELDSGINETIQKSLMLEDKQSSIILGARYDYDSSSALKFEIQQLTEDMRSGAGEIDETGMLYSVAIDLVF
jgi:hypothetical protein